MTLSGIPPHLIERAAALPGNAGSRDALERGLSASRSGEPVGVRRQDNVAHRGVQGRFTVILSEPPSLNEMLDMAKERMRVQTKTGARVLPVVYARRKVTYETKVLGEMRKQGVFPPSEPWTRWKVEDVVLRRRNLLDVIEALACLKWPIDSLVKGGYVSGDSPRELAVPPMLHQRIDRGNRGITLTIVNLSDL